jgi:hypothetical protein
MLSYPYARIDGLVYAPEALNLTSAAPNRLLTPNPARLIAVAYSSGYCDRDRSTGVKPYFAL